MAKVNAPLFSFQASGQLAKSLVYTRWKGIDDVRSYATPANPRSTRQVTQRGYFSQAVADYHDTNRTALDNTAMDRAARFAPTPMSGFNYFVKQNVDWQVDQSTLGGAAYLDTGVLSLPDATHFDFASNANGDIASARGKWGYSINALDNDVAMVVGGGTVTIGAPVVRDSGMGIFLQVITTPSAGPDTIQGIYFNE